MDKRVTSSADAPAIAPVAVRDLTKTYGQITAVDHISFTLAAASTVALLGGNGAGKTTTIAMLLGLVVPTSGEVRVFGADMSKERGSIAHRLNFQSPYVDLRRGSRSDRTSPSMPGCTALPTRASASPMSPKISRSCRCSIARPASCRPGRDSSGSPRRC
jgi:energy-coupling factor transporter ATP-binding protein EcfA2